MRFLLGVMLSLVSLNSYADQCDIELGAIDQLNAGHSCPGALANAKQPENDQQQVIVDRGATETTTESAQMDDWMATLTPYIPVEPRSIKIIPKTEINPVLLPDDGSQACAYLKCRRSIIALVDWSDFAFNYETGCAKFVSLGGHADLGANSVYEFCVGNLSWARLYDYSQPQAPFPDLVDADGDGRLECVRLDEGPFGSHAYDGEEYIPTTKQTVMLRTTGYDPKWRKCKKPTSGNAWAWHDDGYYIELNLKSLKFPRAAYDAERDKLYVVAQGPDAFWEIDPHTFQMTRLAKVWAGKSGVMVMDKNRDIYFTSHNGGLYKTHISIKGTLGPIDKLVDYSTWINKGWGLDVSDGIIVGWDGGNNMIHYDTHTNKFEKIIARGDVLPITSGVQRVYGKFIAVPSLPGVFIGIADNYGWVIYKAF